MEQVTEFQLLDPCIPVGGELFSHDAKLREGKWFAPYLSALDHWETEICDVSVEGLLRARKVSRAPSDSSRKGAEQLLRRRRRDPIEFGGRHLPSAVCTFLLRVIPRRLRLRVSQGQ